MNPLNEYWLDSAERWLACLEVSQANYRALLNAKDPFALTLAAIELDNVRISMDGFKNSIGGI